MMDGDVSHSSELKLLTLGVKMVAEVVCTIVFLSLLLHCYVYKPCVYFPFFFFFFFFFLTSGASSPEWVKPTAEGGGLLGIYVLSYLHCFFVILHFCYILGFYCVHIAIMADGRQTRVNK
jgi:hypothetical protein